MCAKRKNEFLTIQGEQLQRSRRQKSKWKPNNPQIYCLPLENLVKSFLMNASSGRVVSISLKNNHVINKSDCQKVFSDA